MINFLQFCLALDKKTQNGEFLESAFSPKSLDDSEENNLDDSKNDNHRNLELQLNLVGHFHKSKVIFTAIVLDKVFHQHRRFGIYHNEKQK